MNSNKLYSNELDEYALLNKEKIYLENEKLKHELKVIRHPFWGRISIFAAYTTAIVAILGLLLNIYFSSKESKIAELKSQNAQLIEQRALSNIDSINNMLKINQFELNNLIIQRDSTSSYLLIIKLQTKLNKHTNDSLNMVNIKLGKEIRKKSIEFEQLALLISKNSKLLNISKTDTIIKYNRLLRIKYPSTRIHAPFTKLIIYNNLNSKVYCDTVITSDDMSINVPDKMNLQLLISNKNYETIIKNISPDVSQILFTFIDFIPKKYLIDNNGNHITDENGARIKID